MKVVVLNDTSCDMHHGCHSVMLAIHDLLSRQGFETISYWAAHKNWLLEPRFCDAVRSAKLLIINGEGTIHHERLSGRLLLEAGVYAKSIGVPVALINTGWEANGPGFSSLLDNFDLLAARDSRSAKRMAAGGANVRCVPDLSIWYARNHAPSNLRGLRAGVGLTDNVDRFKSLALEHLRQSYGAETLAITYGKAGLLGWAGYVRRGIALREDLRNPVRLANLILQRHRQWRAGDTQTNAFIERIAALELLVSGRFHACTFALATGTPVIAQSSNTGKIAALFHDAGLENWRGEVPMTRESLERALERGWSASERTSLDTYLCNAVKATEDLFVELAELAAW